MSESNVVSLFHTFCMHEDSDEKSKQTLQAPQSSFRQFMQFPHRRSIVDDVSLVEEEAARELKVLSSETSFDGPVEYLVSTALLRPTKALNVDASNVDTDPRIALSSER